MGIELVDIGFGNIVAMNKVKAITSPKPRPIKHLVQEARNKGLVIDLTSGRKMKAAIVTNSGHIILSALTPETITARAKIDSRVTARGGEK